VVCQVCGAKSGIHPLCPLDYMRYTKGEVVKCSKCHMLRAKKGECLRCSNSLSPQDIPLLRDDIEYWGKKLYAIAMKGEQWGREDHDKRRYDSVSEISREIKPFWEDSSKSVIVIPKKKTLSWSNDLQDIADSGLQQSDEEHDISRYSDILRISDEIRQEIESYFEQSGLMSGRGPTTTDVEFVTDRDIAPRLVGMLERAEKMVLIASPWVGGISDIIGKLEELHRGRNVDVRIIVRPPEPDKDIPHRNTVKGMFKLGFHVETDERLHAKMVLVDDKEAYIGSANLTPRSMDKNLEVGICTSNPEVVSKAAMYFEQVFQEAFDKRLDSKV